MQIYKYNKDGTVTVHCRFKGVAGLNFQTMMYFVLKIVFTFKPRCDPFCCGMSETLVISSLVSL